MRVPGVRGSLPSVFSVAFDYQQWWSARWLSRMFTSLAVAVALALSGGPLAGSLSAWSEPFPADRQMVRFDATTTHPAHPVDAARSVRPAADGTHSGHLADGAVPIDPDAGRAGPGGQPALPATGAVPTGPTAPAANGFAPVRPLVGALPGSVGSRAPPAG